MKYKIGVFGSALEKNDQKIVDKARELGKALSNRDVIVINGACKGLPYEVAYSIAKTGKEVWGFSPEVDFENQKKFTPNQDFSIYSKLFYIPKNYEFVEINMARKKYRNISSTASCDAGIIISGRWGTMNKFTNLYDMGKIIGILTGTGGVADEIENLSKKISKKTGATLIFDNNPKELVKKIIDVLEKL